MNVTDLLRFYEFDWKILHKHIGESFSLKIIKLYTLGPQNHSQTNFST